MKPLKRLKINSDTNLFAINGIVVPSADFFIEIMANGRNIKIPIRSNPHVSVKDRVIGVYYRITMPVLACHPISDTDFYTEVGTVDVAMSNFSMSLRKSTHWAYLGTLPDVAESDVRDKRYVVPITVHQAPTKAGIPDYLKHIKSYGATLHADYLRTSALNEIDDETWEQLRTVQVRGRTWKEFLEQATSGSFTVIDDLSNCLIDLDAEFVPNEVVRRVWASRFEKRMRGLS